MSSDPNKKVKSVFSCLDWRLHPQIENYFTKNGAGADMCVTAGSIKGLINPATQKYLLEQIEISKKLHNCQAVILTMHMDCGAYGGSAVFGDEQKELNNCKNELCRAKKIMASRFPDLAVETYVIALKKNKRGWDIEPKKIDI
jgi:carbonic anhydrase